MKIWERSLVEKVLRRFWGGLGGWFEEGWIDTAYKILREEKGVAKERLPHSIENMGLRGLE